MTSLIMALLKNTWAGTEIAIANGNTNKKIYAESSRNMAVGYRVIPCTLYKKSVKLLSLGYQMVNVITIKLVEYKRPSPQKDKTKKNKTELTVILNDEVAKIYAVKATPSAIRETPM